MTDDDVLNLLVELQDVYADLVRVERVAELGLHRRVREDLKAIREHVGELTGDYVA